MDHGQNFAGVAHEPGKLDEIIGEQGDRQSDCLGHR